MATASRLPAGTRLTVIIRIPVGSFNPKEENKGDENLEPMSVQLFGFVVLVCLAAVQGAKLNNVHVTDIVAVEMEGRSLQVPTLGDVIFAGLKTTWFLISTVWSFVGYKLAAVALAADVVIWIARNCLAAIVGAGLTLAFCKLTGKCTWDYAQEYDLSDLTVAAKHLESGAIKFTS